jgi:hypothetical protein
LNGEREEEGDQDDGEEPKTPGGEQDEKVRGQVLVAQGRLLDPHAEGVILAKDGGLRATCRSL